MTLQTRETEVSILELLPGDIIRHSYKEGSVVDVDEAKRVTMLIREMIGPDAPIKVLNDLRTKVVFTREARDHFKNSGDETTSMAFLINSKIGEVTVNFFLKLNNPSYRMRIFSDLDEAMDWLAQG